MKPSPLSPRLLCVVLVGVLAAGAVASARPASACSLQEPTNEALVPVGAAIPANVRGVPVRLVKKVAGDERPSPTLLDASGVPVVASIEEGPTFQADRTSNEYLIVPAAPLAVGSYTLKVAGHMEVDTPFSLAPPAALPSVAPVLTVSRPYLQNAELPGGPVSCSYRKDSAVIDITVTLPESYRPFRDLVDLEPQAAEGFLYTSDSEIGFFRPRGKGMPETLARTYRVARACTQGATTSQVRFKARVRGVAAPPTEAVAELTFPYCHGLDRVDPDGTSADADAGCSIGSHAGSHGYAEHGFALVVVAAATFLRRLRRRGQVA